MSEVQNFETMKSEIRKMVAEIAETSEEDIKEEDKFVDDLGVDSMMALEIVAGIEKKYKIRIPEEELPRMDSLKSVFAVLREKIK